MCSRILTGGCSCGRTPPPLLDSVGCLEEVRDAAATLLEGGDDASTLSDVRVDAIAATVASMA